MSFQKFFGVPIRFISRSSVTAKAPSLGTLRKKDDIKLDDVKVPVETDPHKLVNYVCGTDLLVEGGENIKVKPDSEYPEWLWKITSPLPLEQLDKNSKTYWNRINKIGWKEHKYIRSLIKNSTVHK